MNNSDPEFWFSRFEKLLAEQNARLRNIETILTWIGVVMIAFIVGIAVCFAPEIKARFGKAASIETTSRPPPEAALYVLAGV